MGLYLDPPDRALVPCIDEKSRIRRWTEPDIASRATTCLKHQAALSVAYGAGLRAAEIVGLNVANIDSERPLIRVEGATVAGTAMPCFRPICLPCCASGGRPGTNKA